MGRQVSSPLDYGEGTHPHCPRVCHMGSCVGYPSSDLPLTVVACIHSRTSRDSRCMHILHTLAFIEGRHSFSLHSNTLTLEQTTSSTISHETISLPSSIRYPRAITDPPLSRPSCWSCFWTQHWIGSHLTGSGCLEVLSRGDLTVDHPPAPSIIKILLKWSKTNQAGRGADVVLGRTGLPLFLVAAVMAYIAK